MKFNRYLIAALFLVGCKSPTSNVHLAQNPEVARAPAQVAPVAIPNYCMAVRGNGQNIAAHWIAMARLVEKLGLPQTSAGGSSASISLFLLDSLAANPIINNDISDPEQKRRAQGLMLKTISEFVAQMATHDKLATLYTLAAQVNDSKSQIYTDLMGLIDPNRKFPLRPSDVDLVLKKYGPILNAELFRGLIGLSASRAKYYAGLIQQSAKMVLGFDAMDADLFFRPGILDFKYFALIIGTIGDFYAGNAEDTVLKNMSQFIASCSNSTFGTTLSDSCRSQFDQLVNDYLGKKTIEDFANARIFEPIGTTIQVLAPTAILTGDSLSKVYLPMKTAFLSGNTKIDYTKFSASPQDIKYGYYGDDKSLAAVQAKIGNFQDLKSSMFTSLGRVSWFTVLSTSPAEPGLASFQPIPNDQVITQTLPMKTFVMNQIHASFIDRWAKYPIVDGKYSAGGWADLQPMLVLKASGCENVAYVTRQNGETTFGQQSSIRIHGEDQAASQCNVSFWRQLGATDSTDVNDNNNGRNVEGTRAQCTTWNQLWNRGNLSSSHNLSLLQASVVVCTNWDHFSPPAKAQEDAMLADALKAPIFVSRDPILVLPQTRAAFTSLLNADVVDEPPPGCVAQTHMPPAGP